MVCKKETLTKKNYCSQLNILTRAEIACVSYKLGKWTGNWQDQVGQDFIPLKDQGWNPRVLRTLLHLIPSGGRDRNTLEWNAAWWQWEKRRAAGRGFLPLVSMSSQRRARDKLAGKAWRPILCWKAPTPRRMHVLLQEPCQSYNKRIITESTGFLNENIMQRTRVYL